MIKQQRSAAAIVATVLVAQLAFVPMAGSAEVTARSDDQYSSGGAQLAPDGKHRQQQQRSVVTTYPAGTTSSARGGDTVSLTSTDFCGTGAEKIVCTGTDSKVSSTVLPTAVVTSTATGTGTTNALTKYVGPNALGPSRVIDDGTNPIDMPNLRLNRLGTSTTFPLTNLSGLSGAYALMASNNDALLSSFGWVFRSSPTGGIFQNAIVSRRFGFVWQAALDFYVHPYGTANVDEMKLALTLDDSGALLYGLLSANGVALRGSTSGSIARQASATGGVTTLVEPSAPPTAVGQVLAVSSLSTTGTATNTATLAWKSVLGEDATISTLPPLALASTGTITETVTNTDTSTVTNTATYTGTETGSVTAYDADTITITGTATGQSAALLDPTVTATVTGSGTRTNTWTRTLTVSVVAVGTQSATASTTALSYALYQPADTFSASATNTWSSSFTGSGTGTSTTTRTGSGTVTSTLSATSSTATGSGSGTIAGPADYTGTFTYTRSTTGTGVTTATYTFSVSNTGTGTGTGTATLTVVSATASTTASGTATAALTSTHTENATLTVTNTSSTTSTSTSTSTATQTTTGMSTNASTGRIADNLTISGGGSTYTLPIAGTSTVTGTNTSTLGGVKVGPGITRADDGTISVSLPTVPTVVIGDAAIYGSPTVDSGDGEVTLATIYLAAAPSNGEWIASGHAIAKAVSTTSATICSIKIGTALGTSDSLGQATIPAGAGTSHYVSLSSNGGTNWEGTGPTQIHLFGSSPSATGCVFESGRINVTLVY